MSSRPGTGDTYGLGETIRVRVTFSEAVAGTGSPQLKIDMDPADWGEKWAVYESGGGTDSLNFAYEVVEPNESTQGAGGRRRGGGDDREHGPDAGGAAGAHRAGDGRAGGHPHRGADGAAAAARLTGAVRRG